MNIEKLAASCGLTIASDEWMGDTNTVIEADLVAFAQAYARATLQTKPVAEVIFDKNKNRKVLDWLVEDVQKLEIGTLLFTLPPSTVPLEKYNKLLDAFKSARNTLEFANELGGPISDTIWHGDAQTLFDFMDSIIAEAEGKEG